MQERQDMKRQMSIKKIDIIIKDTSSYALDLHTQVLPSFQQPTNSYKLFLTVEKKKKVHFLGLLHEASITFPK